MNLFKNIKVTKVLAGAVSAGTELDGTAVDMSGYEGVVFFGTIATANAGNFLKAQEGLLSDGSDGADLSGSKVVAVANAQVVWNDVYKPQKRYVRPVIIRAGANTITGDVYALQYGGRLKPETNLVLNALIGSLLISPDEGTA